ncbi:DNA binding protein [Tricharina praecox]|uniref:DNA binding protein n=1 Tax=Tricharina praecox TaxID=43433 RepID=UPI00221F2A0B|nr:DNA binding protein [Tricharina praecox]KAI5856087.1 DNA binding protein [Tricharina praecox]
MKIKKLATAKHEATLSPFIRDFTTKAISTPLPELVPFLQTFPRDWPFPRGDLYHWITLLNRFDTILEEQVIKYKFKDGPQTISWEQEDKALLIGILDFTRLLVENCGNRSLYASSGNVGELLNTTDVDVLLSSLRLTCRLAQRYYTSRTRGGSSAAQATLLASHYNINLNKVVTLATPFLKSINGASKSASSRAFLPIYATDLGRIARGENPVDPIANLSPSKGKGKAEDGEGSWEEWGGAWISYYVSPKVPAPPAPAPFIPRDPTTPTPTRRSSLHHSHTHSHHQQQVQHTPGSASRSRPVEEPVPEVPDSTAAGGMQTLEIPSSRIKEAPTLEEIIESTLPDLPTDSHYEFLHRLRVASALAGDLEKRRKILAVRILALTNLAYVYNEQQFAQKILVLDQDEPRRLQLPYQLAELVQGGERQGKGGEIPKWLQSLALGGLEALARHKTRNADVCGALSVNVNHGVLLYLMRKAVAELSSDDSNDPSGEAEEWREALFSLMCFLPTNSHTAAMLISAGLVPILVDLINMRTTKAHRLIPKALSILDHILYSVPNAIQTFANAKGLDAVVDLVSYETQAGLEEVRSGKGIPDIYRTEQTDYKISHQRQQTLKMVTKFMQHMMGQSGAGVDRLLRNLVDNPKLLEAIRLVIGQGGVWGSHIWSTVVGMISAFIHNEPTSYAVIHEAHITHAFLEAITGKTGLAEDETRRKKEEEAKKKKTEEDEAKRQKEETEREEGQPGPSEQSTTVVVPRGSEDDAAMADVAKSPEEPKPEIPKPEARPFPVNISWIMPSQDAIGSIPTALGAICLNPLGLDLIQASGSLDAFFEIFESPAHVKVLIEGELDNLLGTQFDELVRHHPNLRESVLKSTLHMLDRVVEVGKRYAVEHGIGAKVWLDDGKGGLVVSGGRKALAGSAAAEPAANESGPSTGKTAEGKDDNNDVEMSDVDALTTVSVGETNPDGAPAGQVVSLEDICTLQDLKYEESEKDSDLLPITDYIDVAARYLEGFITNTTQTRELLRRGGLDKLLEFYSLPSLPYDFATSQANQTICRAMHLFCESNLLDTLQAVFTCAQKSVDKLQPFLEHIDKEPYFAPLTNPTSKDSAPLPPRLQGGLPASDIQSVPAGDDPEAETEKQAVRSVKADGTTLVKNLVTVHALAFLLQDLYHQSMFNARQSVQVILHNIKKGGGEGLIAKLGALQRQCVWEEIQLQKGIPADWDEVTRTKDSATNAASAIEEAPVPPPAAGPSGAASENKPDAPQSSEQKKEAQKAVVEKDGHTSWFRNVKTIRFLIGQIPTSINPFLQGLAKCVINRRNNDTLHKYLAFKLVDGIGHSMYKHLTWERIESSESITDKYGYWIVMLSATMSLLLEGVAPDYFNTPKNTPPERQPFIITTALVAFKQLGGLEVIKKILRTFWNELQDLPASDDVEQMTSNDQQRMAHAYGGIRIILLLFSYLVSDRAVQHAGQSEALHMRSINDSSRADYFNTSQLLIELRASILPVVQEMWESSTMEKKATSAIVKSVVEILGIILRGDHESSAFTRKELEKRPGLNNIISWQSMVPQDERIKQLTDMGFSHDGAQEALMRCSDNVDTAASWLSSRGEPARPLRPHRPHHDSMDEDDDEDDEDDGTDVDIDLVSGQRAPPQPPSEPAASVPPAPTPPNVETPEPAMAPPPPPLVPADILRSDDAAMSIETPIALAPASDKGKGKETEKEETKAPKEKVMTIEDLGDLRAAVRDNLVSRSLDVLQVQAEITFELAELIRSAFEATSPETRKDVASTIFQSLLSLQMEDDFRSQAKTIASTAHLLGLVLQNQGFYEAAVEDLNDQLSVLIGFIKVYPGSRAPWIANILLVVEKLLSENAQPDKIKFTPGQSDTESPVVESSGIKVSDEDQDALFDAIVAIMPHVDKEDSILALAVTRVLVLLTRRRELSARMVQGGNLQKVFHMYRRQAGNNVDRLQPAILMMVRHVIEDEETLRAVMTAEIRAQFSARPSRQLDTNTFAKNCAHLILRNPEIFVDVVAQLCKLSRYEPQLRNQGLILKETEKPARTEENTPAAVETQGEGSGEAAKKAEDEKPEETKAEDEKPKTALEVRPPGVEKPDGVIHFLLMELFAIKDVNDFTPPPPKEAPKPADTDVALGDASKGEEKPAEAPKPEKPEFKAEHYPYFFYRCFILMTLMELLCCYNRCKVEFINFNRKADPRDPITPSKPRSAIFNYLLHDLISQQSLTGPAPDDIEQKTKDKLSQWAIHLFVSLCTQSGEVSTTEDEPDLLFVRKFFFETALKSFKDACASTEPLDIKYARMASLGDLFYKVLSVRPPCVSSSVGLSDRPQHDLAKIMLEKNYISALTNALADVDLNYPNSRKVIKSMLKPLKLLSKTAVELSETSGLSTPGATDDDDISVASSLSSIEELREETPDLYRNSTLGLFEGGEMGDDDASDYDEDEDDEEMYDHEMEFEEEIGEEGDSEVSDEDEEEGAENMDVEVVIQDDQDDDDSDSEDDDDMSEDDMDDDGGEVEIIDELGEHLHHHSHHHHDEYESGGEEDWQSDGSDDNDMNEEELLAADDINNGVESIMRALEDEGPDINDDPDDDGFLEEGDEEDEMEGEEEDDDLDEEAMMAGEDYDDDDEGASAFPWGWAEGDDAPIMTRTQPRSTGGWFTFSGGPREPPVFMTRPGRSRHYLGASGERVPASNREQNPLLQQADNDPAPLRHSTHRHEYMGEWAQAFSGMHPGDGGPVSMISTLMNLMNRGGVMHNGAFQIQATIPHHRFPHGMQREIRSMFGNFRPSHEPMRLHREDPNQVGRFEPSSTPARWMEEARILFGNRIEDSAQRIVDTILYRLVPVAIEEEKKRKALEEQAKIERAKLEEEKAKKTEEERIEKEKAEAEEKARKEAEEKEAAERAKVAEEEAAAAEAATRVPEGDATEAVEAPAGEAMAGVEATQTEIAELAAAAGPSAPVERATVMIRGREMDITGMGIDPEFLEAIPEEMREEALTQHIRERRAAAASSDQASEISREFLDALPDDIRQELLDQEAQDRRRREQEAARAQGGGGGPGDMDLDLATFLATLEPGLRQTVLMEQDDEALAHLPHAILEEANALRGDRVFHGHFVEVPRNRGAAHLRNPDEQKVKKPARKGTVQLLDKAGVATLLRLMFMPQSGSTRVTLHEILLSICENRQNRAEVVNLLLSILQDGSADMAAVERCFAQLSVRAKQPTIMHPPKTPVKTPTTLSRSNTGPTIFAQTSGEVSPLMVAQQCLLALTFLVNYNEHISSYFLNEHDINMGLKKPVNRKGKGKAIESKASKYALNTLLALLDRPLVTESSSVMDQLSVLLSEITRPLTILLKKDKKKSEEEKAKEEEVAGEQTAAATATGEAPAATATTESATEPATAPAPAAEGAEPKDESKDESKDEAKDEAKDGKEEEKKKPRNLVPPVVPEHNLRLVVNILTARECSSKTFRETLATMQNLSGIPGSKDVFGAELIRQAQGLGSTILGHLDELLQQVRNAENGTEVQGMALANFSPASSEQAKLLRVLTALDYLFDPKRTAKEKSEEKDKKEDKKEGEAAAANEEFGDVLAKLYESLTFSPLWSKLSDCLTAIHERSDMLHVATILLPLIEALMVVCKNGSLEESTQHSQLTPEARSMRQLFFKFTEDHRKILNQMVRNNPKLMSGSFSQLVKNPKVLDFDNKRNFFNRRLHTRQGVRDPHPTLPLAVRRDQVFLDSYKSMYYKTGDEIKYAKLSIRFHGEEGVDAGGVTREWFQVMSRQMFNPDYALFIPVASDRTTFHPNSMSGVNPEHLSFFKFIGRIIGKALYEGRVLDCHFSRAVYKKILGKPVSLKDMETLDLEYYKSMVWMLENNIEDVITETFSVELDEFGARQTVDLIPDGRNIPVTNENKQDYVRLVVEHRLLHSVNEQIDHFLIGFHDIVPADLVNIFNEQELELLISGMPEIDLDDWRNNTEYHNYSASSSQIQWFWRAVRSFDKEERAKLLQFVTGTSKVPLNGFKELEGMNGFSKFNIHRDYGNKDRLPSSHTCFNQLDLPEYESYETLRQQLLTAITQGAEYFGFA